MSCVENVGDVLYPIPLHKEIADSVVDSATSAKFSSYTCLEGYVEMGKNYRIGRDKTHEFSQHFQTITGRAIIPHPLDRIVTVMARERGDENAPQEAGTKFEELRLPSTLFFDVKNKVVFVFDHKLIELQLNQNLCPDENLKSEFDTAFTNFWKLSNALSKVSCGYGSIEYENSKDVPDSRDVTMPKVNHIAGRLLSSEARVFDCLTKQWMNLTDTLLEELNQSHKETLSVVEEYEIDELTDVYMDSRELKWQLPSGEYDYLKCIVDKGMIILFGKQKNPVSESNGLFLHSKFSYKTLDADHWIGSINQDSLIINFIRDSYLIQIKGAGVCLVKDTLQIYYKTYVP